MRYAVEDSEDMYVAWWKSSLLHSLCDRTIGRREERGKRRQETGVEKHNRKRIEREGEFHFGK